MKVGVVRKSWDSIREMLILRAGGMSFSKIERKFGYADHTSVVYHCHKYNVNVGVKKFYFRNEIIKIQDNKIISECKNKFKNELETETDKNVIIKKTKKIKNYEDYIKESKMLSEKEKEEAIILFNCNKNKGIVIHTLHNAKEIIKN